MNIADSRPVYVQLIERIYTMVLSGEYPPGAKLPAVRELAEMMRANPNTVQRALFYLEEQGLIYTQRTTGKYITDDKVVIEQARQSLARDYADEYLQKMRRIGLGRDSSLGYIKETEEKQGGTDRIQKPDQAV
ncbi:MAG: GntR family transcriptional regulator [Clostridia bacterium]|nr:GntR family transcriptional regulator [Clostridia bacterium]